MLFSGKQCLYTKPGERSELYCPICDTKCEVKRNCYGPTCFAEAVGGLGHLHDGFTCPHRDEDWHHYASQLIDQKHKCASRRLQDLIDLDLQETLTRRSIS
ncbi:hypothetical protein [Gimesia sp.]|uniref:hypothetical protein n=1 Tax=Gimesia sp. TaxID=2024833 RepID=UPI003A8CECC1